MVRRIYSGAILLLVLVGAGCSGSSSDSTTTTASDTVRAQCTVEKRVIQTAAEAYNAQNGRYPADVNELFSAKLLEEKPKNYELVAGGTSTKVTAAGEALGCS